MLNRLETIDRRPGGDKHRDTAWGEASATAEDDVGLMEVGQIQVAGPDDFPEPVGMRLQARAVRDDDFTSTR